MSAATFQYLHRVTYSLCAIGDHVYYSRYLELLEAARGEFFRFLGKSFADWQQAGTILPVIECHLKFKAAARYDDLLSVEVWVSQADGVRVNFGYRVTNQKQVLIVEGETWHACAGLDERPQRLPRELKEKLTPHLHREKSEAVQPISTNSQ